MEIDAAQARDGEDTRLENAGAEDDSQVGLAFSQDADGLRTVQIPDGMNRHAVLCPQLGERETGIGEGVFENLLHLGARDGGIVHSIAGSLRNRIDDSDQGIRPAVGADIPKQVISTPFERGNLGITKDGNRLDSRQAAHCFDAVPGGSAITAYKKCDF